MQDKIQEIMGLVEYYNGATTWGTTEQQIAARSAIESKLRELVREPLSVQYPRDMNSINVQFVFSAGWHAAERAHNITNTSGEA